MIKQVVSIALSGAAIIGMNACKSGDSYKKLEGGLEYKIVKDTPGDKHPVMGDVVEMHITFKVDDSVLAASRKENHNQPVPIGLHPSQYKGDWTNGITLLTVGDSAVFRMSVDSLKKTLNGQMLPPFMEHAKMVTYEVVLVSIKSQQEIQQEQDKRLSGQKELDDKALQDYFAKNNLQPTKTASGLYYTIEKPGSGPKAKPGQAVSVNYTGKTLEGRVFDSNTDPKFPNYGKPFTFALGTGGVIPGWDEGLTYFNKGAKGSLFVPSYLAYGEHGAGDAIGPNSVLVFDVEVQKIEDAPKANTQQPLPTQ